MTVYFILNPLAHSGSRTCCRTPTFITVAALSRFFFIRVPCIQREENYGLTNCPVREKPRVELIKSSRSKELLVEVKLCFFALPLTPLDNKSLCKRQKYCHEIILYAGVNTIC